MPPHLGGIRRRAGRRGVTALAGFWGFGADTQPKRAAERMLDAQAIYAPARPVVVEDGAVAIGRRLFNLLPEDRFDHGPVVGAAGRWTLAADVRLDNRDALAEALSIGAPEAARLADSALLMRALERWEEAAVERLVGDFAFAAWDRKRARLLLGRDYLGMRPLHYHRGARFFAFASMPKGLHALPDVPRAPDRAALTRFLALLPEAGESTFFEGIDRVPPGHLCIVTRSGVERRRWWNPARDTLRLKRAEEYHEAVREQLDRAVASRLRGADGKVATHLSGGLDSSAVTATAARLLAPQGGVLAFTAVPSEAFDEPVRYGRFADEGAHAAAVAALYPNVEHVFIRTAGRSPIATLDQRNYLYERPVLNLCNSVWVDAILDAAKARGVSVLLTGQMGNHSFSYNGFERLPALLRRGRLLKLLGETLALRRNGIRLESAAAHTVGPFLPTPLWRAIHRWLGRSLDLQGHSLVDSCAAERLEAEAVGHDSSYRPTSDPFAARLRRLGRVDLGPYNKGMLGGWGVDVRDPSADRRLVELCLAIPTEQHLRAGQTRALARGAFRDRLPPLVVEETRKGLQAPDWYQGVCAARAGVTEEAERIASLPAAQGILDTARLRRLVADWPEAGWTTGKIERAYRLGLLRGISGGHFLRSALGSN
jgi:asparagine synthase (glutamine-hydrolysing)